MALATNKVLSFFFLFQFLHIELMKSVSHFETVAPVRLPSENLLIVGVTEHDFVCAHLCVSLFVSNKCGPGLGTMWHVGRHRDHCPRLSPQWDGCGLVTVLKLGGA